MPDYLPEKYRYSHDYALFLNDILTDFVKTGEEYGIFHTSFELKDEAQGEGFEKAQDDGKWEWLEANGYGDALANVIYRQVTAALLSDFCHFVFEALSSSKKGIITVAYSLLRKPFKDNLFYLEWLLADPEGFIEAFTRGGPDMPENHRRNRATRFPIIEEAIRRTRQPEIFEVDLIDEMRYDRQAEHGFAGTWDQASHLITTFSAIRTSQEGFNFVFSAPRPDEHWAFLYERFPFLLYYAVEVVEGVIARLVPASATLDDSNRHRRSIGFMLRLDSIGMLPMTAEDQRIELPECPHCGIPVLLDIENMRMFVESMMMKCQKCRAELDAGDGQGGELME
jgi:hypothetical protein